MAIAHFEQGQSQEDGEPVVQPDLFDINSRQAEPDATITGPMPVSGMDGTDHGGEGQRIKLPSVPPGPVMPMPGGQNQVESSPDSMSTAPEARVRVAGNGDDEILPGYFTRLFDSPAKKITAIVAGGAMLACVGVAATHRGGDAHGKDQAVATQPKDTTRPRAAKPIAAAPSPSDLPSLTTTSTIPPTANSSIEASPNTAPGAAEILTTPANNAEFLAKLKSFINPAQVEVLQAQYGSELTGRMSLNQMDSAEKQAVFSKQNIGEYQNYIRKVYADKKVARILGDPQGWIDMSVMTAMPADAMGKLIVTTTDSFLNTVAQQVHDPLFNTTPGIDTGLVDLATLSPFSRNAEKNTIAQGANHYTYATEATIVAVKTVTMPDGSPQGYTIDIVETVAKYSDGSTRFAAYMLVPVGSITPDLGTDAVLSLQIYRHAIG